MVQILNKEEEIVVIGNGLFTQDISISLKRSCSSGIIFQINGEEINAHFSNISNAVRNTVLSNGRESICLIEHFLACCSILNIDKLTVSTSSNELIIGDGSAIHWYDALSRLPPPSSSIPKMNLRDPILIRGNDKDLFAIPHNGFKVSYFLDYNHPLLSKLWADFCEGDDFMKIICARTFASKEENNFFNVSKSLLTFDSNSFNMPLREPLEPAYHKILDIIGDLMLSGINPLSVNMHVVGFRSGHDMNTRLASELAKSVIPV